MGVGIAFCVVVTGISRYELIEGISDVALNTGVSILIYTDAGGRVGNVYGADAIPYLAGRYRLFRLLGNVNKL